MGFDKNKAVVIASLTVVFIGLCTLVGLGHDSTILDALLAVSGGIAGIGGIHMVTTTSSTPAAPTTTTPSDKPGT
jgi:hypothetical protein